MAMTPRSVDGRYLRQRRCRRRDPASPRAAVPERCRNLAVRWSQRNADRGWPCHPGLNVTKSSLSIKQPNGGMSFLAALALTPVGLVWRETRRHLSAGITCPNRNLWPPVHLCPEPLKLYCAYVVKGGFGRR